MSVAPSIRELPLHKIPARLKSRIPGAKGNDNLICWRFGEGPFFEAHISEKLLFRPDPGKPDKHGLVEPSVEMAVDEYQMALAGTQDQWVKDEE